MTSAKYNCVARFDVKIRPTPDTYNSTNIQFKAGTQFQVSEIVSDRVDPTNPFKKWGKIFGGEFDGMYTALEYPNNSNPISTYTLIQDTPPTPTGIYIVHEIDVYNDGSITVDGKPIPHTTD